MVLPIFADIRFALDMCPKVKYNDFLYDMMITTIKKRSIQVSGAFCCAKCRKFENLPCERGEKIAPKSPISTLLIDNTNKWTLICSSLTIHSQKTSHECGTVALTVLEKCAIMQIVVSGCKLKVEADP